VSGLSDALVGTIAVALQNAREVLQQRQCVMGSAGIVTLTVTLTVAGVREGDGREWRDEKT
jgi:hypothetical protein